MTELKRETDKPMTLSGNLSALLATVGKRNKQKIRKYLKDLINSISPIDLTDIFKTAPQKRKICIRFNCT